MESSAKAAGRGLQKLPDDLVQSVKSSPEHEGTIGRMSEKNNKKGNQNIPVLKPLCLSASSQWNVEIIPKPGA